MKKPALVVLSLLATLGLTVTAALPADASSSPLHLSWAHPNSKGSDRGEATSLNDEWVKIGNYSYTTTYTLMGDTLKDAAGHTHKFPTFKLSPRKSVEGHTGARHEHEREPLLGTELVHLEQHQRHGVPPYGVRLPQQHLPLGAASPTTPWCSAERRRPRRARPGGARLTPRTLRARYRGAHF